MTLKEENIVNITAKAMDLLHNEKIHYDEEMGFLGFTQEIVSLAERFEKEYGHIDWNSGYDDYWMSIDEFAERELLALYGPEPEIEQISAFHVIGEDAGQDLYYTVNKEVGLVEAANYMAIVIRVSEDLDETPFEILSEAKDIIDATKFSALIGERVHDNTGRVAGIYEMDFKQSIFSAVHITNGWHSWLLSDVIPALKQAGKSKSPLPAFIDALDGKELHYYNHPASDLVELSKLPLDEQIRLTESYPTKNETTPNITPER